MILLAGRDWALEVGDPTVLGWSVCFAYFVVAYLCWWKGLQCVGAAVIRSRRFWMAMAILLVVLGFNKQLDLQKLVLQIGRNISKRGGWYEERKPLQVAMSVGSLLVFAALAGWCIFLLRREPRTIWLAVAGLTVIAIYIAIRSVSLHEVEWILYYDYGPVRLRDWMELIGLVPIAIAAGMGIRSSREFRRRLAAQRGAGSLR